MARNLFRGAPELSRLFLDAPTTLMVQFVLHEPFAEFLRNAFSDLPLEAPEDALRKTVELRLNGLPEDRVRLIEAEARRITAVSDPGPDALLRRLRDTPRFSAFDAVRTQRDAVARSLWCYLHAEALFEATERAMQVQVYRGNDKLYEMWSIESSASLAADEIHAASLAQEIAERLYHEEGCEVEAVDLPAKGEATPEVLLAVTFFGAFSSQRTVLPDRTTRMIYFRPPDELLLVYSSDRRRIEVCSRDPVERRLVANIFAEVVLGHDVSNKPLTQKTYNLARFRKSLRLPIPEEQHNRVRRATITEVQVALGNWSRKVTLTVQPDDDIDALARKIFGAIIPLSGGGYITKVGFCVSHTDSRGKSGTLRFHVFGRNRSSIQSERNPAKRALGYELLEAWGVLERVSDLTRRERIEKLPQLLALYDLIEAEALGALLDDLGINPDPLVGAGFLARRGWSDVVLLDDDELGEITYNVTRDSASGTVALGLTEDDAGPRLPENDAASFEIRFDYLRETLRGTLEPLGLRGRVQRIDEQFHFVGTTQIGVAKVPVYLARGLSDDRSLERVDRLVRSQGLPAPGIVFFPQETRFAYLGCHVALSLAEYMDLKTGVVDADAVRTAFEASVDPAARGAALHFRNQGGDAAQLTVPGQDPLIVIGPKKVLLFERLYIAHRDREAAVKLAVLKKYAGFSQLPQLFGEDWSQVRDRYLHSPRHGYWAIGPAPISV